MANYSLAWFPNFSPCKQKRTELRLLILALHRSTVKQTQLSCCRYNCAPHSLKMCIQERNHCKSKSSQAAKANCKGSRSTAKQCSPGLHCSPTSLPVAFAHLPTSARTPQSVFPRLSSEKWAAFLLVQSLIYLSYLQNETHPNAVGSPNSVAHPHKKKQGGTLLTSNADTSTNTSQRCPVIEMRPTPAHGRNHLDPIRQSGVCLGMFMAILTWGFWGDVNLTLPAYKCRIPCMPVELTRTESQRQWGTT